MHGSVGFNHLTCMAMPRLYDHIDLRVPSLAEAWTFYESLLPALGFTRKTEIPGWLQYEAEAPDGGPAAFFGVTESTGHVPNESRIAFWVENTSELDRLTGIATCAGARNLEGPGWEEETYYAAFFEDPCGNRLELCHRTAPVKLQTPRDLCRDSSPFCHSRRTDARTQSEESHDVT